MRLAANIGCEADVLANGEVREEDRSLWCIGQVAKVGWDVALICLQLLPATGSSVDEVHIGGRDEAAGGAEEGALSAAGGTKEDGPRGG